MPADRILEPLALVSECLECEPTSLSRDAALGVHPKWDSLGHLRIMMALESQYGVAISDETIRRYDNLAAIVARYDELTRNKLQAGHDA